PPRQRYWRGPVLADFDGRTWRAGQGLLTERAPRWRGGTTVRYSVLLEAHHRNWLFALESPAQRPPGARRGTQRGQALVELALVVPLLILLAVSVLGLSRVLQARMGVVGVAREAARAAALAQSPAEA